MAYVNGVEFFILQLNESDIVIKRSDTTNSRSSSSNNNDNNDNDDIVYCDDSNKSLRSLEKSLRLNSIRIKDFVEGLESYLESHINSAIQPMQKKDR